MKKNEYLDLRNGLIDEAENLINEGKIEEGQAKMAEISDLDNRFENEAKELANLNTLKDNVKIADAIKPVMNINLENKDGNVKMLNSTEYRNAFKDYVLNGTEIPAEFRNADASTKTGDVQIPEQLQDRIYSALESKGGVLAEVTKTNFKTGIAISVASVLPEASLVAEGRASEKKKIGTTKISFTAYKLQVVISRSLEVATMSLSAFENFVVNTIVDALTKKIEYYLVNGTGSSQPQGLAGATPKATVNIAMADALTIDPFIEAIAKIDSAYEDEKLFFVMSKATLFNVLSLKDSAGQPIARVNMGLDGRPSYNIYGVPVLVTSQVADYVASPSENTTFAYLFNFKGLVLNSPLNLTIKSTEDFMTDDQLTKGVLLFDSKVVDANSLVKIVKNNA